MTIERPETCPKCGAPEVWCMCSSGKDERIKTMTIEELLDQLGEYQAQKDLLDLDKQALIDAVKIPAEVLEAQRLANMDRQRIDANLWKRQRAQNDKKEAALSERIKPDLPPEYVIAMEAYRLEGVVIERRFDEVMEEDQKHVGEEKAKLDTDLQSKIADVYDQVAMRKAEIVAEFEDKAAAVVDNIAKLTAEIKEAVKAAGKTVRGVHLMAVWVKGRDGGWDTKKLQGYALAHPEILTAKQPDGEPSITIRKI